MAAIQSLQNLAKTLDRNTYYTGSGKNLPYLKMRCVIGGVDAIFSRRDGKSSSFWIVSSRELVPAKKPFISALVRE